MVSTLSNPFDNFAKEFLKLNVNMDKITKIFEIAKLSEKIVSATQNIQRLKIFIDSLMFMLKN